MFAFFSLHKFFVLSVKNISVPFTQVQFDVLSGSIKDQSFQVSNKSLNNTGGCRGKNKIRSRRSPLLKYNQPMPVKV